MGGEVLVAGRGARQPVSRSALNVEQPLNRASGSRSGGPSSPQALGPAAHFRRRSRAPSEVRSPSHQEEQGQSCPGATPTLPILLGHPAALRASRPGPDPPGGRDPTASQAPGEVGCIIPNTNQEVGPGLPRAEPFLFGAPIPFKDVALGGGGPGEEAGCPQPSGH